MAKKAYVGVDGVARRITKAYIGVDGVARRIKKAYIGVGGVARLCYSINAVECVGQVATLLSSRYHPAAASTTSYALFGGGATASNKLCSTRVYTVDAISTDYVRTAAESLPDPCIGQAVSFNNYAVFYGGTRLGYSVIYESYGAVATCNGCYYNDSLTIQDFLLFDTGVCGHAAVSTPKYCIFGGGVLPGKTGPGSTTGTTTGTPLSAVRTYDASFVSVSTPDLSVARYNLGAAPVGSRILFAGGDTKAASGYGEYVDSVDVYDSSLTRSSPITLPVAKPQGGVSTPNHAVFYGDKLTAYAYNASLTVSLITLAATIYNTMAYFAPAASYGRYAFILGRNDKAVGSSIMNCTYIDTELVTQALSVYIDTLVYADAATVVGNSMLFGGGGGSTDGRNIHAITITD